MNPPISPVEIAAILLTELLFGIGYNGMVAWVQKNHVWHVSISVVFGVVGTLLIPSLFWFAYSMIFWQAAFLLIACFAFSGMPMIIGSTRRSVESHKRREWPNGAKRIRDDVVMDLSQLANDIADSAKQGTLTAKDLPDFVRRIYQTIGTLKSV